MEALLFQSDSDCPSPLAVQEQVRELTTPEQRAAVPADARVMINDRGDRIAISITRDGKTTVRLYRDAARDCPRRAHFVSVLSVVALMPPALGGDETEDEPEPQPETRRSAPREPQRESRGETETETETKSVPKAAEPAPPTVRLELAGVAHFSAPIADTVRAFSPGVLLGVALGAGSLRLTLSTHYAPRSEVALTGDWAGRAQLERLDVSAGARYVLSERGADSSVELALLASRAQVGGLDTRRPTQDAAFSLGARAGVHVGFGEQRLLSPFVGAHAQLFPFAPAVTQLPQGTVGHLPYVWLGLSAGLALAL